MTDPTVVPVPAIGDHEYKGELTDGMLQEIVDGLLIPNQGISKAITRELLKVREEYPIELSSFLHQTFGCCYTVDVNGLFWCQWKDCTAPASAANLVKHADTCPLGKFLKRCKYDNPFCPCQDGDICHYEGENPMERS